MFRSCEPQLGIFEITDVTAVTVLILDDVWKFLSQSEGNTSNQSSFGVDCAALARSRVVELVGRRLGPRKCFVTTKYFIIGT